MLIAKWLCKGDHGEVLASIAELVSKHKGEPWFEASIWQSSYTDERRERAMIWEMNSAGYGLTANRLKRSHMKKTKLYIALTSLDIRLKELKEEEERDLELQDQAIYAKIWEDFRHNMVNSTDKLLEQLEADDIESLNRRGKLLHFDLVARVLLVKHLFEKRRIAYRPSYFADKEAGLRFRGTRIEDILGPFIDHGMIVNKGRCS
ncbi:MAG: hypothetical protein WBX25_16695 [Rhodomicrobium sp.]